VNTRSLLCALALLLGPSAWGQTTLYVDDDAAPGGAGTTWATAHRHLQDALSAAAVASPPVEIRVAQGVYLPDRSSASPLGSGSRLATFALVNGVALRGGYAGPGAPNPDTRNTAGTPSFLDGDLLQNDLPGFVNNGENAYNVLTGTFAGPGTVLDGFVIRNGNANGASSPLNQRRGAGMWCQFGSPQVFDCEFRSNHAFGFGGAIYNRDGSSPSLTACRFVGNAADAGGGALYNAAAGDHPALIECRFEGNSTSGTSGSGAGGAIFNVDGSLLIQDCAFEANTALVAGAIEQLGGAPTISRCSFVDNSSTSGDGGAILLGTGSSGVGGRMEECIFGSNDAASEGGALACFGAHMEIRGCLFSGSSAVDGGAVLLRGSSSPTFIDCDLTDNSAISRGGAMYDDGTDVSMRNVRFIDNDSGSHGGALVVANSSADLRGCVFTENFGGGRGGAVYNDASPATYTLCRWLRNNGTSGGAVHVRSGEPTFRECRWLGNRGSGSGGALYGFQSNTGMTVVNGLFVGNRATSSGAALYLRSPATLVNCTLAENVAPTGVCYMDSNGGVYSAVLTMDNSILWNPGVPTTAFVLSHFTAVADVTHSDVQGGWAGTGNLALDPLFLTLPSPGGDMNWGTADDLYGNLRLDGSSPCIDAGDIAAVPLGTTTDLQGCGRLMGADVDMGAFECMETGPRSGWVDVNRVRTAPEVEVP
jgi:hypothetical protein